LDESKNIQGAEFNGVIIISCAIEKQFELICSLKVYNVAGGQLYLLTLVGGVTAFALLVSRRLKA